MTLPSSVDTANNSSSPTDVYFISCNLLRGPGKTLQIGVESYDGVRKLDLEA